MGTFIPACWYHMHVDTLFTKAINTYFQCNLYWNICWGKCTPHTYSLFSHPIYTVYKNSWEVTSVSLRTCSIKLHKGFSCLILGMSQKCITGKKFLQNCIFFCNLSKMTLIFLVLMLLSLFGLYFFAFYHLACYWPSYPALRSS